MIYKHAFFITHVYPSSVNSMAKRWINRNAPRLSRLRPGLTLQLHGQAALHCSQSRGVALAAVPNLPNAVTLPVTVTPATKLFSCYFITVSLLLL